MPIAILRAGDERTAPVVFVHPVSGRADVYRPLADALDWPGRVLGVSAPEPAPDAAPDPAGDEGNRLTDLANRYCDELDLRMPPLLIGWSIGGVIAAEMSRTLAARGGTVGFLGVLDSRAPQPEMQRRPTDRETLARSFLHQIALTREHAPLASAPASTRPGDLLTALRTLGAGDEFGDEAEVERRLQVFMGLIRAFFHHVQQPVPVTLHLFESADAHPSHPRPSTLGWDDLAPAIERHEVAGTHFTLLAPHRIEALAKTIRGCLPR